MDGVVPTYPDQRRRRFTRRRTNCDSPGAAGAGDEQDSGLVLCADRRGSDGGLEGQGATLHLPEGESPGKWDFTSIMNFGRKIKYIIITWAGLTLLSERRAVCFTFLYCKSDFTIRKGDEKFT